MCACMLTSARTVYVSSFISKVIKLEMVSIAFPWNGISLEMYTILSRLFHEVIHEGSG